MSMLVKGMELPEPDGVIRVINGRIFVYSNGDNPELFIDDEVKRETKRFELIPDADVCPYYVGNKHDRGDDSLCRKAECEVKDVRPVKRGKFIFDENDYLHCSECDCSFAALMYTVGSKLFVRPNYCPNCGAEMRGVIANEV